MGSACHPCKKGQQIPNTIIDTSTLNQSPTNNKLNSSFLTAVIQKFDSQIGSPYSFNSESLNFSKLNYKNHIITQTNEYINSMNERITISYPNGSIYEGEIDAHQRKEGKGILKLHSGSRYIGEFKNDNACGKGQYFNYEGEFYQGDFLNNNINGFGIYINKKGVKYEGFWINGEQNGLGKEFHLNGSRFEGNFLNGKKNGLGKIYFSDGSFFEGDFLNNNINGYGILIWPSNKKIVYMGEWKENNMEGIGKTFFNKRKMYFGNYKDSKREGLGILFSKDKIWVGYWKSGLRHGKGIYIHDKVLNKEIWIQGELNKKIGIYNNEEDFIEIKKFYDEKEKLI